MSLQFSYELQKNNTSQARDIYTNSRQDIKLYIDPHDGATIGDQLNAIISAAASTETFDTFKWLIDVMETIEIIDTNNNEEYIDFAFDFPQYFKSAIEAGNMEVAQRLYRDCNYVKMAIDDMMLDYIKRGQLMMFKALMYISRRGINPAILRDNGISEHVIEWYERTIDTFNRVNVYTHGFILF